MCVTPPGDVALAGAPQPPRDVLLRWQEAGTVLFERSALAFDEPALRAPSPLAGWSRAHIVGHVARNADALVNLLTWARTGVETPMYPDNDVRAADIEASARQPAGALREDLLAADRRYAQALQALPAPAWSASVRTAQGRTVTAETVPWMRIREVWVHAVDLGGARFADLPAELAVALLHDALTAIGKRPGAPRLRLEQADGPFRREIGEGAAPQVVSGSLSALCGYVLRGAAGGAADDRLRTADGGPPPPLRWL